MSERARRARAPAVRVAAGRRGPRPGVGIKGVTMAALAVWALASALVAGAVQPERFDTVVLDPGHGGDDHGAEGPRGLLEKDLTLDVARRLARELEARGLRVVLSRREDRFVGLAERTRVANEARADLFVSIHANGAEARAARGVETYFASLEASDEAAKRLAIAENEAFGGAAAPATTGSDPLAAILGDMIATEHLVDSQEFARLALEQLAAGDATHSRGVKQAPFVVLMGVEMPAALVEIGFITNVREEAVLTRAAERDRIAKGLAAAVAEYGRRYDARRGGEPGPSPAPAAAAAGGGSE